MSEREIRERLLRETDAKFAEVNYGLTCPVLSWENCYILVRNKISKELDEKDAALLLSSQQPSSLGGMYENDKQSESTNADSQN